MAELRERAITLTGAEVRAVQAGTKTQKRLLLTPRTASFGSAPRSYWGHADFERAWVDGGSGRLTHGCQYLHVPCHRTESDGNHCDECDRMGWRETSHRLWPRWRVEDQLFVKEAIEPGSMMPCGIVGRLPGIKYSADLTPVPWREGAPFGWCGRAMWHWQQTKPLTAPFMPIWASRLCLKVTGVCMQRLQEITEQDAVAEGMRPAFDTGDHPLYAHVQHKRHLLVFEKTWDELHGKRAPWSSNPWVVTLVFKTLPNK